MSEYVHLIGAEQVSNAGHAMARAAEQMSQAASNMSGYLEANQRWMDDWLNRLQAVIESAKAKGPA